MRRTVAAAVVVAALVLASCAHAPQRAGIAVSGTTRADLVRVGAPRLAAPALDVAVGVARSKRSDIDTPTPAVILRTQIAAGNGKAAEAAAAMAARRPTPAGMLTSVTVRPGDRVKRGQLIARFDDTLLALNVANAKAAAAKARAQAGVLSSLASDLRGTRADVRTKGRAQLAAGLAQLDAAIATAIQLQPAVPAMKAQLAQLQKQFAQLRAKPVKTPGDLAHMQQLTGQITKLAQAIGLAENLPALRMQRETVARTGAAALSSALSKMASGIDQLDSASEVTRVFAGIAAAGVTGAEAALAQAALYAPADGVVVDAMHSGEVPMVGAPVVTIRPSGPTLVDTYLTPEQLEGVKVGTTADVTLDSLSRPLAGTVHDISAEQGFAPSNYPTKIVHLSSVVRVTVSVPQELPAGIPADVVIGDG